MNDLFIFIFSEPFLAAQYSFRVDSTMSRIGAFRKFILIKENKYIAGSKPKHVCRINTTRTSIPQIIPQNPVQHWSMPRTYTGAAGAFIKTHSSSSSSSRSSSTIYVLDVVDRRDQIHLVLTNDAYSKEAILVPLHTVAKALMQAAKDFKF